MMRLLPWLMLLAAACTPVAPKPGSLQAVCDPPHGALVYVAKDAAGVVTGLAAIPSSCVAEAPKQ